MGISFPDLSIVSLEHFFLFMYAYIYDLQEVMYIALYFKNSLLGVSIHFVVFNRNL